MWVKKTFVCGQFWRANDVCRKIWRQNSLAFATPGAGGGGVELSGMNSIEVLDIIINRSN